MDFQTKSDGEIKWWIANHEAKSGGVALPLYAELLEERARRSQIKQLLNQERSLESLKNAAIRQTCVTYGDLAIASDVPWAKAHHQMNGPSGHLDRLFDLCHARKLPPLTAICVNQEGVVECELSEGALNGFIAVALRLGLQIGSDRRTFHHQCRDECWNWGRSQIE